MSEILKKHRNKIDKIDEKIIRLIAKRFYYTQRIGELKAKENLNSEDLSREKKQFLRYEKLSKKFDLDKSLINKIFKEIITKVKENHGKIKQSN